jgi:hypothetical protein
MPDGDRRTHLRRQDDVVTFRLDDLTERAVALERAVSTKTLDERYVPRTELGEALRGELNQRSQRGRDVLMAAVAVLAAADPFIVAYLVHHG